MRAVADGVVFHVPMTPKEAGKPLPARTAIAWTVSNLTAKDGKPFNLEARREVQVWTRSRRAAPDPMREPAAGRTADGFPRLLLWAFLGGALMNLAPTVLALLLAGGLLAASPRDRAARSEGAAAAVTGVVGGCWAVAGLALLARRAGLAADWPSPAPGARGRRPARDRRGAARPQPVGPAGVPPPRRRRRAGAAPAATCSPASPPCRWRSPGPCPCSSEPIGRRLRTRAGGGLRRLRGGRLRPRPPLPAPHPGAGRGPPAPVVPRRDPGPGCPACARGSASSPEGARSGCSSSSPAQVSPEGLAAIELALLGMSLLAWLRARQGTRPAARLVFVLGPRGLRRRRALAGGPQPPDSPAGRD